MLRNKLSSHIPQNGLKRTMIFWLFLLSIALGSCAKEKKDQGKKDPAHEKENSIESTYIGSWLGQGLKDLNRAELNPGESALFVKIDPEGRVYFFQAPDWVLYGNIQPDGSLLLAPELVEKAKEERIHLRVQFFRLNSPEQLRFCREETLLDSGENLVPGTSQVECQLLSKTDTEQMAKQVAQEFNKTEESREPHQVVVFTQTISSRETPSPSSVFLQRSDSEVPSKRIWEYLENTQIIIEQNILNWSNNYEE